MVERGGLENRCRLRSTVGSNPTPSATEYLARRGARAVEWARLESACTLSGTVGSNPTPSATSNRMCAEVQWVSARGGCSESSVLRHSQPEEASWNLS